MAHHVEPMDVDCMDSEFDNKENNFHHSNVLPCTEKGYEELDVSELNMKLRYSITPVASPMSKSYTACIDNRNLDHDDSLNSSNENTNLSRSLNSTMTKNDSVIKSLKALPLQSLPTEQFADGNGNASVVRQLDSTITENTNVTVTVTETHDIDENLSLPSSSSSALHTPEATTPTKDMNKNEEGSPIIRGLKSVFNMFRSSQSPIPPTESETKSIEHQILSPEDLVRSKDFLPQAVASTPIAAHRSKDANTSKRSSPYKDSIVFNDDLEKELHWKDETTVIFSDERIPIHKLFFQHTKQIKLVESTENEQKPNVEENLNTTVEYMDISYNDSVVKDRTMTDIQKTLDKTELSAAAESDSEFVDCETTFTRHESPIPDIKQSQIQRKDSLPSIDLQIPEDIANAIAPIVNETVQLDDTNISITNPEFTMGDITVASGDFTKETNEILSELIKMEKEVSSSIEKSRTDDSIKHESNTVSVKENIHDNVKAEADINNDTLILEGEKDIQLPENVIGNNTQINETLLDNTITDATFDLDMTQDNEASLKIISELNAIQDKEDLSKADDNKIVSNHQLDITVTKGLENVVTEALNVTNLVIENNIKSEQVDKKNENCASLLAVHQVEFETVNTILDENPSDIPLPDNDDFDIEVCSDDIENHVAFETVPTMLSGTQDLTGLHTNDIVTELDVSETLDQKSSEDVAIVKDMILPEGVQTSSEDEKHDTTCVNLTETEVMTLKDSSFVIPAEREKTEQSPNMNCDELDQTEQQNVTNIITVEESPLDVTVSEDRVNPIQDKSQIVELMDINQSFNQIYDLPDLVNETIIVAKDIVDDIEIKVSSLDFTIPDNKPDSLENRKEIDTSDIVKSKETSENEAVVESGCNKIVTESAISLQNDEILQNLEVSKIEPEEKPENSNIKNVTETDSNKIEPETLRNANIAQSLELSKTEPETIQSATNNIVQLISCEIKTESEVLGTNVTEDLELSKVLTEKPSEIKNDFESTVNDLNSEPTVDSMNVDKTQEILKSDIMDNNQSMDDKQMCMDLSQGIEGHGLNETEIKQSNNEPNNTLINTSSSEKINENIEDVEIIVSENNSPYVSLMADTKESVPELKPVEDNFEEIQNPFAPNSSIANSPPITSKGYNFNFDEIDDPFATKTKIRLSPPLDTPTKPVNHGNENTEEFTIPKKDVINRRKSQPPERKRQAAAKKKFNTTIDACSTSKAIVTKNEIPKNEDDDNKTSNAAIKKSTKTTPFEIASTSDASKTLDATQILQEETIQIGEMNEETERRNETDGMSIDISDENKLSIDSITAVSNEIKTTSSSEQSAYYSAAASSSDSIRSKNVFNLPEIDDVNFNPFATKSKMRQSPPPDTENENPFATKTKIRMSPDNSMVLESQLEIQQSSIDNKNKTQQEKSIEKIDAIDKMETELMEKDTSINISHASSSKCADNENLTAREVNTEDEDTIEGPFLEAEDVVDKMSEFGTENADMMNFSDIPAHGNEDAEGGEMFIDAEAFEFLLNQNKSNVVADSGKESLFLKFDPLFAARISSDGVLAALNKVQKNQSTPTKPARPSLRNEASPIAGPSNLNVTFDGDTNASQESVEDPNVTVSKPMMVVTPAVNPAVTPRNKSVTPTRTNRRSITFTSPAIAVIDRLLSMSANNSLLSHDTTITQVTREQNEADLALTQLRELLAEKEINVYTLRSESKELKDRLATMESQMKTLEADGHQRLKKINELNERLIEKTRINKSMAAVVEEYERTIASLIAETEQDKKQHAEERMRLISERDEQTAHLASMEVSFSDLHSKYEKSKQVILACKANEETYKKSIKDFEENLTKMQSNYELLKQHATSKLNHANQELEKMNRSHEAEVLKLNAMIKRKDLHITSLEETLAQKTKANEELTAICDELINKVG